MKFMPSKKLTSILSTFEKTKTQLSDFIDSTKQEVSDMQDKVVAARLDQLKAEKSLAVINSIVGE